MTKRMMMIAAALLLPAAAVLAAEPGSFAMMKVYSACKTDITTLCPAVKPGEGRILACLSARQDAVSQGCKAAAAPYAGQADKLRTLKGPSG